MAQLRIFHLEILEKLFDESQLTTEENLKNVSFSKGGKAETWIFLEHTVCGGTAGRDLRKG